MIFKLHKIPDKVIFRAVFALLILWNLKYFFLILQVPFSLIFVDYMNKNAFYSQVTDIRHAVKGAEGFQDEGKIGFTSDTLQESVFDIQDSIRDFYIAQYAVVPSILKNDTEENFVIGTFEYVEGDTPKDFKLIKKINEKTYLYKRINK